MPINQTQPGAEAVRKLFTHGAEDYARLFEAAKSGKNFSFRERLAWAAAAGREKSGRLLDCAAGPGEITTAILAQGTFTQATVLDLSPKMLELASSRIKRSLPAAEAASAEFVCNDVFGFARENSHLKFDLILCLGLVAHTGRLPELLSLLRVLLARDGILLLQTTLLDHLGTRVERFFSAELYVRKHGYRIHYFRHRDILAACAEAGLQAVKCRRFTLGIPFGDKLWAGANYHLESMFRSWASVHGSEAMYSLKVNGTA